LKKAERAATGASCLEYESPKKPETGVDGGHRAREIAFRVEASLLEHEENKRKIKEISSQMIPEITC